MKGSVSTLSFAEEVGELRDIDPVASGALMPAEEVVWSGAPARGLRLRASDAFVIPFSLMWGGFAIFWELQALKTAAPLAARFWGASFVLLGVHMT